MHTDAEASVSKVDGSIALAGDIILSVVLFRADANFCFHANQSYFFLDLWRWWWITAARAVKPLVLNPIRVK